LPAGALGGAVGPCLVRLTPPRLDTALPNALAGAAVWGLAAAATGALAGLVIGPWRGRRVTCAWVAAAAFWSALPAAVEAEEVGPWAGARGFVLGLVALPALFAAWPWLRRGLRRARWALLAWLVICLAGEAHSRLRPTTFTPLTALPDEPVAQLWSGPLSEPLDVIARHFWFVTFDPAEGLWHRWEVWQLPDHGGTSWRHVHEDLLAPGAWYAGGPGRPEREWRGAEAEAILRAVARSPEYPYRDLYFAWPGPNSNTYPAWVLREAGVSCDLDPRAIGRDYHGPIGTGRTTTGTGWQAESSVLGVKVGLGDGAELHFLCFTLGIDVWPPAIKTPLGRVGFRK
jgi:hypothetical protein